ncbi:MAG: hypothetical protein ABI689_12490 [Thermoanaerobaculia bacterium]
MGLREVLSKLKLVEVGEPVAASGAPSRAAAGSNAGRGDEPDIAELLRTLPPPKPIDESLLARSHRPPAAGAPASAAARLPAPGATAELDLPDFPAVYRAAGIGDPPHGFTAFKVLEMLQSPGLAELPPQAKASALAGFLKMNPGGPVAIGEVIQDAVRRDQALDRFEQFLHAKLAERQAAAERANSALQAEIDALTERHRTQMTANTRAVTELTARLSEWSAAKRTEERKLQAAVAPFVEGNPITTDSEPGSGRSS